MNPDDFAYGLDELAALMRLHDLPMPGAINPESSIVVTFDHEDAWEAWRKALAATNVYRDRATYWRTYTARGATNGGVDVTLYARIHDKAPVGRAVS